MRLIKNSIERKDGSGSAVLLPEEPEDMWHAYNLIREGDYIEATALRKVATESASGATTSKRVRTTLRIIVTKLDFDTYASQLHVSGKVVKENQFVGLGSYHTLDLELQRNFTLEKADGWDSVALETLKDAISAEAKAQLWAVIMEEGMANIALVTDHQTILRQKIELKVSKKVAGSSDHDKQLARFFRTTFDSLLRQIDLSDPKPILLASPGFTASVFQQYIKTQASDGTDKRLKQLVPKITVAHSASGHYHDLALVMSSPAVTKQLSDARFARETQLMDRLFELMRLEDARAWYGPKEIEMASEHGAIGKGGGALLISDSLFRSQDIKTRKRWVKLVDEVKEAGGEVRVFSSLHESGKRLEDVSGIAAILTYPIEGLDDQVLDEPPSEQDVETNGNGHVNGVEGRENGHVEDIDF